MSDNLMKWNPIEAQSSKNVLNNIGLVSEMSIPLKRFRERSDGIRLPLIRHWCLCKWCQLFDKENQNLNHWKDEVFAFIDDLQSIDIKNGISKKKTLTNMWLNDYDFNNANKVFKIIRGTFRREGIEDESQLMEVSSEFASNGVNGLIDVISNDDINVDEYIEGEFDNPIDFHSEK